MYSVNNPFTVTISIYNIGTSDAVNIHTNDRWPSEIPIIKGSAEQTIDIIKVNDVYEYTYTAQPNIEGM